MIDIQELFYRADVLMNRCMSTNTDFHVEVFEVVLALRREVEGPRPHATWQDAAIHERMERVKLHEELKALKEKKKAKK